MLSSGQVFQKHYKIARRVGVGTMGAVYAARDLRTQRTLAVKVMLPGLLDDPDAARRFEIEKTALARVQSDHLVPILDGGIDAETDCPFLVMDYLEGTTLAQTLVHGPLAPSKAVSFLRQLAAALDTIHAHGIVHRDLKPANILLEQREGGSERLRLLDFGVAKLLGHGPTETTLAVGTPAYMAPGTSSWRSQPGTERRCLCLRPISLHSSRRKILLRSDSTESRRASLSNKNRARDGHSHFTACVLLRRSAPLRF